MTFSDHGGFDLALELTEELLSAAITGAVTVPIPADRDVDVTDMRLRVHVATIAADSADVQTGEIILAGGQYVADMTVLSASVAGAPITLPAGLAALDLRGTFAIPFAASVGTVGGMRGVVLTPVPAASTAKVDKNALFASPAAQLVLAAAFIAGGEVAYQQRRQQIADQIEVAVVGLVRGTAAGLSPRVAVAEPSGVTLAAVRTSEVSLKVLVSIVLPPGNAALAAAISVRRNALGGPLDLAALVINNGTLLTSVRTAVSAGLGIPATFPPWAPGHPSAILSSTLVTPAGVPTLTSGAPAASVFVDFFLAQINPAGLLQLDLRRRAVGFAGLATVTTSATATVPIVAMITAGTLTVGLGTPAIAVTSDVQFDPGFFLVAILLGQFTLFAVLTAIDLFAGPFISTFLTATLGAVTAGLPLALTLPLTGPFAALSVTSVSGIEPGAPIRIVTLPGPFPIPLPLDRVQDVTVRMA